MERVLPDSNVLYPISVADLTLRLADVAVHEVLWSEDLLAEVERILIERKGLEPKAARYFCDCIRDAFPHGEIAGHDYEALVATRTGPDSDDRVHAAAAVGGGATVVLTWNTRDFPARDLGGARAVTPDTYFVEMLELYSDEVLVVVEEMGAQRRQPQPVEATLAALDRAGLKQFSRRVTDLLSRP